MAQEKQFETQVRDYLHQHGAWSLKYWGGGGFTKSGVPDLLVCLKGLFFGIELKAPNGRPTPLQIRALLKIREAGGFGILLYPKDYELFQGMIDCIMNDRDEAAFRILLNQRVDVWARKFGLV